MIDEASLGCVVGLEGEPWGGLGGHSRLFSGQADAAVKVGCLR